MRNGLRHWLIGGAFLGVAFSPRAGITAMRHENPDLKLRLRVYDYVGIPPWVMTRALKDVKFIFGHAGVVVTWNLCTQGEAPAVCSQAPGPLHAVVRIVDRSVPGADDRQLGYASESYITVNYPRVQEVAARSGVRPDRILGCVLGHELGHVLLGPNSHSTAGIMTAAWKNRELKLLRMMPLGFLPAQEKRIRAQVIAEQQQTAFRAAGEVQLSTLELNNYSSFNSGY